MTQIKKDRLLKAHFNLINKTKFFQDFKQTFATTKGITLIPVKVEELFIGTYERMEQSNNELLENTINMLTARAAELKTMSVAVGQ